MLEHFADALVGFGGALEVLLGADLLADIFGLCSDVLSVCMLALSSRLWCCVLDLPVLV